MTSQLHVAGREYNDEEADNNDEDQDDDEYDDDADDKEDVTMMERNMRKKMTMTTKDIMTNVKKMKMIGHLHCDLALRDVAEAAYNFYSLLYRFSAHGQCRRPQNF